MIPWLQPLINYNFKEFQNKWIQAKVSASGLNGSSVGLEECGFPLEDVFKLCIARCGLCGADLSFAAKWTDKLPIPLLEPYKMMFGISGSTLLDELKKLGYTDFYEYASESTRNAIDTNDKRIIKKYYTSVKNNMLNLPINTPENIFSYLKKHYPTLLFNTSNEYLCYTRQFF